MGQSYAHWRTPLPTCPSDIHRSLDQVGLREGSWRGISMESGGKGSFQAAKLQRSAQTAVCSHSTGDMAAMRSIESKQDHKRYSGECLSCCEHILGGGKNERPDALFSQAVAPLVTFIRGNDAFTLLGMTWADPDLIQVQENVIAKTVNSLSFAVQ